MRSGFNAYGAGFCGSWRVRVCPADRSFNQVARVVHRACCAGSCLSYPVVAFVVRGAGQVVHRFIRTIARASIVLVFEVEEGDHDQHHQRVRTRRCRCRV